MKPIHAIFLVFGLLLALGIGKFFFDTLKPEVEKAVVKEAVSNEIEKLRADARAKHPGKSEAEAMQLEAIAQSNEKLKNTNDPQQRQLQASHQFMGFYMINVEERAEYCNQFGTPIPNFVSTFSATHSSEYAKARSVHATNGVDYNQIKQLLKSEMRKMVDMDMQAIAQSQNISVADACRLMNDNASLIVAEMALSKAQPTMYQALMNP